MTAERDFYEVLGVDRDADTETIRRAFRARSQELHPDISTDAEAEERFFELTRAYRVLSRPHARVLYDRLGYAAPGREADAPADHDSAVFDLGELAVLPIEAEYGTTRRIAVTTTGPCVRCDGTGTALDEDECWSCDGTGFAVEAGGEHEPCRACEGTGRAGSSTCPLCQGTSEIESDRSLKVRVPEGSHDGTVLAVPVDAATEARLVLRVRAEPDTRIVRYAAAAALVVAVALFVVLAAVPGSLL